ncbi:dethiobiotin synthase [Methylobacterium sp. 4-46]|uniref:dethiobiotin synthase n=1 Tax=unclassified Methylobacterium TaxID=2615210 RepID=UPI000152CF06|nr:MULTISPECIES: dethiobiotin synthase [Methylobacterium]ACA19494.1 dethiobiotin synthase [Methylobacterium sp. 4-46]WFT78692.1 dethiobiotin synthase [Methylobacterium nodulans]
MSALFVAGAGTEIGKTYVTAALTRALRQDGRRVLALKPVASGVPRLADPDFAESDTARLLAAQDLPVTPETVAATTPWRFAAPLAPDLAAAREGRRLALDDLAAWCRTVIAAAAPGTAVLVEGVGGLMSPLTAEATGLAWLKALGLPTLLVSGSYLGAISHALTAVETLRHHAVALRAVVVSETPGAPTPPETVAEAIGRHAGARVLCVRRGGGFPAEGLSVVPG